MQPHHPFIGKTRIEERGLKRLDEHEVKHDATENTAAKDDPAHAHVYDLLHFGDLERETVERAYRENLELVLPYVRRVIEADRSKRYVITADHGNCFGSYDVYGHPEQMPVRELIEVPWVRL